MKYFLVGHRGSGKTSLLRRIVNQNLFSGKIFDLDEEIEKKYGSLQEIFKSQGEPVFRQYEIKVFWDLYKSFDDVMICLGAGFDLGVVPSEDFILWVRRDSDLKGRIFLDRPRLEMNLDPLVEYQQRAFSRERIFQQRAKAIYTLPEGLWFSEDTERKILGGIFQGPLSTDPSNEAIEQVGIETLSYSQGSQKSSQSYLEIRSDQWTPEEILKFQSDSNPTRIIYAHRSTSSVKIDLDQKRWAFLDWDVRYGKLPWSDVNPKKIILSSHENSVEKGIDQLNHFSSAPYLFKLCPLIHTWDDLEKGYRWWKQDPERRNFLPRSVDGRWHWFRLWMKGKQKINFFRQGPGVVSDQPTFYQWERTPNSFKRFAAVLGSPVSHSFSPSFHDDFFSSLKIPFFAVKIDESEFAKGLDLLHELGLSFAAVTSPLKQRAFVSSKPFSVLETSLESVNTLVWVPEKQEWLGYNTDLQGFRESFSEATSTLSEPFSNQEVLLWGGGGILNVIKAVLPQVKTIKARQGLDPEVTEAQSPKVMVWSSPRTQEVVWPPSQWQPNLIFDLNYTEDSMGLELAQRYQTEYLSGLKMFEVQAKAQQKIWSEYL